MTWGVICNTVIQEWWGWSIAKIVGGIQSRWLSIRSILIVRALGWIGISAGSGSNQFMYELPSFISFVYFTYSDWGIFKFYYDVNIPRYQSLHRWNWTKNLLFIDHFLTRLNFSLTCNFWFAKFFKFLALLSRNIIQYRIPLHSNSANFNSSIVWTGTSLKYDNWLCTWRNGIPYILKRWDEVQKMSYWLTDHLLNLVKPSLVKTSDWEGFNPRIQDRTIF